MRDYGLGRGKWVFVDWIGIEPGYGTQWGGALSQGFCVPQGVELKVHRPAMNRAPAIAADRPWDNFGISPYATFMKDEGRYRCWYECYHGKDGKVGGGLMGYAESDDGATWSKPSLRLKEFDGSKENNLVEILPDGCPHGHGIFKDPSAPPAERYKMIWCCWAANERSVWAAASPDGLTWRRFDKAIIHGQNADTQNVCRYDETLGKYVLYTRQRDGRMQRRGINRSESADFRNFPPSEPVFETSPLDPPDWDLYSSGYCRWSGAAAAHVMQISVYRHTQDTLEVHFATSRDERIWHRPLGRQPWLVGGPDEPIQWPSVYACSSLVDGGAGEWFTFFGAGRKCHNEPWNGDSDAALYRTVLREDGFMSISSEGRGGFWTVPFVLEGDGVALNVRTRYSGFVRCEVMDAGLGDTGEATTVGKPIPGFGLDDCEPIKGDHIAAGLAWRGGDVRTLRGRSLRLRFDMYKADLFALRFE